MYSAAFLKTFFGLDIIFSLLICSPRLFHFFILMFEPDTKSIEHKHTLSAQRKLNLDQAKVPKAFES